MAHLYFQVEVLERFCRDAFRKFGFSEEESGIITDVLLMSDQYGIESHGMHPLSQGDRIRDDQGGCSSGSGVRDTCVCSNRRA